MPTLATCCKWFLGAALLLIASSSKAHSLGHDEHHKPHGRHAKPNYPVVVVSNTAMEEESVDEQLDELIARYALTGNDELIERGWSLLGAEFEQGVSSSDPVPTPARWMQAAWLAQAEHRFELARRYVDSVLATQPRHAQAWMLKAAVATVQADFDSARHACRQVSLSVAPVVALACQLRASQNAEQRAWLLDRVNRLSLESLDAETRAWVWSVRGDAFVQVGELDLAADAYQRSVDLKPSVQARASLSDALIRTHQYERAVALLSTDRQVPALGVRYLIAAGKLEGDAEQRDGQAIVIAQLHTQFSTWIADSDFRHAREMAMFYASVKPDPSTAHRLAVENYRQQREPEDLMLLEQTARQLGTQRSL